MKKFRQYAVRCCLWLYSLLVLALWLLHRWQGDDLWWLALISSFTPFFFMPLFFFWPLALGQRQRVDYLGLGLPTLLFVYLYGSLFLPQQTPAYQTTPSPLRLMTFNVWEGNHRIKVAQSIFDHDLPDIVTLQEVSIRQQRLLIEALGHHYPFHIFGVTIGQYGLGVLSRYPIKRIPTDLLIDLNCQQYEVTVDITHRFRLYNCHPRSTHLEYDGGNLRTLVRQVEETFRIRTLLGERLAQEIQTHQQATIVMGDFNTTDQSDAYQHLTTVLTDAHRAAGWGFGHTFPAGIALFRNPPVLPRLVRIDMIFYSPAFVALKTAIGSATGQSDHLPISAVLAWRATP